MNRESRFSPEEIAEFNKSRALNDAELLKNGADYKVSPEGESQLILTEKQVEEAKNSKNFKEKKEKKLSGPDTLIEAIKAHDFGSFLLLVDKADLNRVGERTKTTPLIAAIEENDRKALSILLINHDVDVNLPDGEGRTPLSHAISRKNRNAIALLMRFGAK